LKPGGSLGLIWNIRDRSDPWLDELGNLEPAHDDSDAESRAPRVGSPFAPLERFDLRWAQRLSAEAIVDLLASRSYVIVLPDDERADLLARTRRFLAEDPRTAGRALIDYPYVTRCSRTRLAAQR
jgi:hypothetical protein